MSFFSEFREFAVKGNVIDLAVGVIIGGAFGKIVDSLVGDVIMPVVSKIFGGLDFSNYFIPLAGQTATALADAKKDGAVLAYGSRARRAARGRAAAARDSRCPEQALSPRTQA